MEGLPLSLVLNVAVLTVFLIFVRSLSYASYGAFVRTKLMMSAFFIYIVVTLTISFWEYALLTLPYTIPAMIIGIALGWYIGVRAAEERLRSEGFEHYMEHFAHVHIREFRNLTWWSIINFYTIMGALILINFVGLSRVIFGGETWAIATSVIGAFFLGTIVPYLTHVWSISPTQPIRSTHNE